MNSQFNYARDLIFFTNGSFLEIESKDCRKGVLLGKIAYMKKENVNTSWENVSSWYNKAVGQGGHHYHKTVILPKALQLLELEKDSGCSLLDLACGQGIFSRSIPAKTSYLGIDASKSLISLAKQMSRHKNQQFVCKDLQEPLQLEKKDFTHASIILALQNLKYPEIAIHSAARHLQKGGKFLIVLNHPCFRIPRQSSWEVDEKKKIQYRRIDRYFSPLEIPILTHPSQKDTSTKTMSYHHSLTDYSTFLKNAGFAILQLEEWCSDKISTGKMAKMENRSREEFPLFLAILAMLL